MSYNACNFNFQMTISQDCALNLISLILDHTTMWNSLYIQFS